MRGATGMLRVSESTLDIDEEVRACLLHRLAEGI